MTDGLKQVEEEVLEALLQEARRTGCAASIRACLELMDEEYERKAPIEAIRAAMLKLFKDVETWLNKVHDAQRSLKELSDAQLNVMNMVKQIKASDEEPIKL